MEQIINILMYSLGGLVTGTIFFLIIYYVICFLIQIINQIKNTD